jgi:hypothetical protein
MALQQRRKVAGGELSLTWSDMRRTGGCSSDLRHTDRRRELQW